MELLRGSGASTEQDKCTGIWNPRNPVVVFAEPRVCAAAADNKGRQTMRRRSITDKQAKTTSLRGWRKNALPTEWRNFPAYYSSIAQHYTHRTLHQVVLYKSPGSESKRHFLLLKVRSTHRTSAKSCASPVLTFLKIM